MRSTALKTTKARGNRLLTAREFKAQVIRLARKHRLHKMADGIRIAGVEVRWRNR